MASSTIPKLHSLLADAKLAAVEIEADLPYERS